MLYTTDAVEALKAKLRRALRARGHFPTDGEARCATGSSTAPNAPKLPCLVLNRTGRAWKMPPREWAMAKAQFAVLFGRRFTRAMA